MVGIHMHKKSTHKKYEYRVAGYNLRIGSYGRVKQKREPQASYHSYWQLLA